MSDDRPLGRPAEPAGPRDTALDPTFSDREVPLRTVARSDTPAGWFTTPPATALSLELMLAGELLPLPRVVHILREVARAIDQLAEHGRVYGALSPSTIAVGTDGRAYLVPPEDVEELRPGYLAPEQRHGDSPETRLDQYALAIIAYELLTGERREARIPDAPALDVVNEIRLGPEHPLRPGLGPTANEVIRRAMARDPGWRFGSATEFVEALATQLDVPPPVTTPDEEVLHRVAAARMARAARTGGGSTGPSPASRFLALLAYGGLAVGAVIGLTMLALNVTGRSLGSLWGGGSDRPSVASQVAGAATGTGTGSTTPASPPATTSATTPAAAQGFIDVRTGGGAATIILDGRQAGTAPATIAAGPGFHTVSLQASGRAYAPAVVTVLVSAGDTASASFRTP
ncbi:PEGA domain-containing protein [Roseisolibacter agri]|nr:PEGA domain-containing protein [Roseisolibacter agri]